MCLGQFNPLAVCSARVQSPLFSPILLSMPLKARKVRSLPSLFRLPSERPPRTRFLLNPIEYCPQVAVLVLRAAQREQRASVDWRLLQAVVTRVTFRFSGLRPRSVLGLWLTHQRAQA
jgi:hypothetical protein